MGCPLRENAMANAVPKEPAPNTVIEEWVKVVFIINSLNGEKDGNEKNKPALSLMKRVLQISSRLVALRILALVVDVVNTQQIMHRSSPEKGLMLGMCHD